MLLNGSDLQWKLGVTKGEREDVCGASGAVDEHHWSTSEQRVAHRFQCARPALHRNHTEIRLGVVYVNKSCGVELMANTTLLYVRVSARILWMLKRQSNRKKNNLVIRSHLYGSQLKLPEPILLQSSINGTLLATMWASSFARNWISVWNCPLVPLSTSRKCVWCGSRNGPTSVLGTLPTFSCCRASRMFFNSMSYDFATSNFLFCTNSLIYLNYCCFLRIKFLKMDLRLVDECGPVGHHSPRRDADAHDRRVLSVDAVVAHRFSHVLHNSHVVPTSHYPCAWKSVIYTALLLPTHHGVRYRCGTWGHGPIRL